MSNEGANMTNDQFPVLYILMRADLPSMNAGKAMAQASHASNAYVKMAGDRAADWQATTDQGFGTVLVLSVNETQMRAAVQVAKAAGFDAGVVNDPTYPYIIPTEQANLIPTSVDTMPRMLKGENTVMFRSEDTCAFVGGDKNDPMLEAIVGRFSLHP
jgi:peptidyl-tRNA hydrolase